VSAAQELPAPELPDSQGTNALSGKTYFDGSTKIEFSATAAGAASGTYTKKSTVGLDDNGKYKWVDIETDVYSWNAAAKQVTLAPRKAAPPNQDGYGPLQTKPEYRSSQQAMLNQYKQEVGDEAFNAALAGMGFSSAEAYLDYRVAEAFKNVTKTNNYALSADAEALFLDEPLPAVKGTDELTGQTYYGTIWNDDVHDYVRDESYTYVFANRSYTYTKTTGGGTPETQTYVFAFDSDAKKVYLKVPTTDRESWPVWIHDAERYDREEDAYAAWVNSQYNRPVKVYTYDTTYKMLLPE
jgi:hypothetical protein